MKKPQKRFSRVYVEISNICNLQCSFCPEVIRAKKTMDPALFAKIIAEIAPLTDMVTFHLMGDPLVHPNLAEFVEICAQAQTKIFLVTNGVLLRQKQAEILLSEAFYQVNFSLHSFPDNFPNRNPLPYLNRIFDFVETALVKRPDLYLNFRLWNLKTTKGQEDKNLQMLRLIEERFSINLAADIDVKKKKSHPIKNRLYLHFDTEFKWPDLNLPTLGEKGRCYGLSSHIGILVDGTVVPCCLDKEAKIPLGNIQERPLADILADQRAVNILEGFKNNRLVEELCKRCNYITRFA